MRAQGSTETGHSRVPYWARPGPDVRDGELHIAGRSTVSIAGTEQHPVFVTDLAWIGVQAEKLRKAFADAGLQSCVRLCEYFVGLNVGWNVLSFRIHYDVPFTIVPCKDPLAEADGCATISGNINEGNDLFAEKTPFPRVAEGDFVAILNAGGYNQAMQSDHCLRPRVKTICF